MLCYTSTSIQNAIKETVRFPTAERNGKFYFQAPSISVREHISANYHTTTAMLLIFVNDTWKGTSKFLLVSLYKKKDYMRSICKMRRSVVVQKFEQKRWPIKTAVIASECIFLTTTNKTYYLSAIDPTKVPNTRLEPNPATNKSSIWCLDMPYD